MVFLGIYRAIYDYAPQGDNELEVADGDLLFVLEKGDDGWWKAKKKAQSEEDAEPTGLVPENYVEEATPIHKAKALYDYTRQTDEELSFSEEAILDVYDVSDPDWTLVGFEGEYGFAPANYIEVSTGAASAAPPTPSRPRAAEPEPESEPASPSPMESPIQSPAAALAGIIAQRTGPSSGASRAVAPPPNISLPPRPQQYTPEESDEEPPLSPPRLPQRPPSQSLSPQLTQYAAPLSPESPGVLPSPPHNRAMYNGREEDERAYSTPGGFRMYNIHEMISTLGKSRKMPTTLGINLGRGLIMISPEKERDGPSQEWSADKLTHYSIEGKHVFMELVRPSKSVDFHAGAKDTAQEIVAALGELAGAVRAEGLREVIAAGSGTSNVQKKGKMLYEFMAQGDDEVTVAVDDEVLILDDTKSDEWWMVRRLKNGKEGVVPSSYVEVTGTASVAPSTPSGLDAGRSTVQQNRLEEERLTRQATKSKRKDSVEVGPGLQLPERNSSLNIDSGRSQQRSKRDSRADGKTPTTSKPKPDASKIRTWTDRSGSFKVDAEFIGLKDGKIHLHKLNGVKIAVPVPKMSVEDLEYVERETGVSLDEDKPLSDIKRRNTQRSQKRDDPAPRSGATIEHPQKPEYDWFDFFLQCGINPQICQRYADAFARDQMGEENMPDIDPGLLRTLGLKEGDILRVMKFLDAKYGRTANRERPKVSFGDASVMGDEAGENGGSLFAGPGGALRNNTRKGRPAPAVQTNDVVDPEAFRQKSDTSVKRAPPSEAQATPLTSAPVPDKKVESGFDDNAWELKPSRQATGSTSAPAPVSSPQPQAPQATSPPVQAPTLTGSFAELSLLSPPLQPTPAPQPTPQAPMASQVQQQPAQPPQQSQQMGATPSLFDQIVKQQPPPQLQQPQQTGFGPQTTGFQPQPTGFQPQQTGAPRQRPQAPQIQNVTSLLAPPPGRSASAPQNFQQSAFGPPPPLQAQLTGYGSPPGMQPQLSPPGQSMQELAQQRMMQQMQQMQPQQTGFIAQPTGFGQFPNGMVPQPTGFGQFGPPQQQPMPIGFNQFQAQQQQPLMTGAPNGTPFANPSILPFQPTGFQPSQPSSFSPPPQMPMATGVNNFLPPALEPQRTGFTNGFGNGPQVGGGFGQAPLVPPIPQQPTIAPLAPQKTGPAPPVRFGVQPAARKLTPQPTGRRANLSHATPDNPFGF